MKTWMLWLMLGCAPVSANVVEDVPLPPVTVTEPMTETPPIPELHTAEGKVPCFMLLCVLPGSDKSILMMLDGENRAVAAHVACQKGGGAVEWVVLGCSGDDMPTPGLPKDTETPTKTIDRSTI